MNISELSLKRPVLAFVMNIILVVFGVIGFQSLGVRDYPAIDPPVINVSTSYSGANADIIESQITEPIEKAVNGIAGIKNITSSSSVGRSNINIEFNPRLIWKLPLTMCATKFLKPHASCLKICQVHPPFQKPMRIRARSSV